MFLGVYVLDLYVSIRCKTPEAIILDRSVLRTRLYFRINHKCAFPFIIYVNCGWIFENTAHHCRVVSLNLEYQLNILHKTHKRKDELHNLRKSYIFHLYSTERYFCL